MHVWILDIVLILTCLGIVSIVVRRFGKSWGWLPLLVCAVAAVVAFFCLRTVFMLLTSALNAIPLKATSIPQEPWDESIKRGVLVPIHPVDPKTGDWHRPAASITIPNVVNFVALQNGEHGEYIIGMNDCTNNVVRKRFQERSPIYHLWDVLNNMRSETICLFPVLHPRANDASPCESLMRNTREVSHIYHAMRRQKGVAYILDLDQKHTSDRRPWNNCPDEIYNVLLALWNGLRWTDIAQWFAGESSHKNKTKRLSCALNGDLKDGPFAPAMLYLCQRYLHAKSRQRSDLNIEDMKNMCNVVKTKCLPVPPASLDVPDAMLSMLHMVNVVYVMWLMWVGFTCEAYIITDSAGSELLTEIASELKITPVKTNCTLDTNAPCLHCSTATHAPDVMN
jgi:hypothetical protein